MLTALATGIVFGLSAGLAPGPLMAFVMAEAIRNGRGAGVRAAFAPLATDLPIVMVAVFVVANLVGGSGTVLGAVALVGACFVAYLAIETARAEAPGAVGELGGPTTSRPLVRGAVVNALSPHPYLFWLTVGAPTLLAAWKDGPGAAAAFVVGFYGCLVGAKVAVAVAAAAARGRIGGQGYRITMRALGLILAVFAAALLVEGAALLGLIR